MLSRTKNRLPLIISAAIVLITLVALFVFSGQNGDESFQVSGVFVDLVIRLFGLSDDAATLNTVTFVVRKLAHFTIFAVLGAGLYGMAYSLMLRRPYIISLAFGLVAAIINELQQLSSVGRTASPRDVAIDFAGVVVGSVIILAVTKLILKSRKRAMINSD